MNRPPHLPARRPIRMLPVLLIVLLAGHAILLYYVSGHVVLSAAILSGVLLLVVIKHVGLLGELYARFRRRRSSRHRPG
jgi:hypothetical protein